MSNKVFVGNLPWSIRTEELGRMVARMGHRYRTARVISDQDTGRSRGFGFVELYGEQAAQDLIRDLNGHVEGGRPLQANDAADKPRKGGGARGPDRGSAGDTSFDWGDDE